MRMTVTEKEDGMTVKEFLAANLDLSSKMLKYLKYRPDGILRNGERVTVRARLQKGDVLTLGIKDSRSPSRLEPVELPLEILYEDEEIVVPSKPADMPTHPSHDHWHDTVANALAFRYSSMEIPFVFRPINRLDRDTSGLLLVARNKLSAGRLTRLMQAGKIRKTYLAIVEGADILQEGRIEKPLRRSRESVIVREVCEPEDPGAEPALTEYRTLARGVDCALVEAHPLTGRTHQLRVHFAFIGHPLAGDTLYGLKNGRTERQALHAYRLSFPHPTTGEEFCLTAPLPTDFREWINRFFPHEPIKI